jgi:hypothetical protein
VPQRAVRLTGLLGGLLACSSDGCVLWLPGYLGNFSRLDSAEVEWMALGILRAGSLPLGHVPMTCLMRDLVEWQVCEGGVGRAV